MSKQLGLFADMRKQLDRNFHEASGVDYPAPSHKLITPDKHKGTPREIVSAYLANTPFEALFYAPIPFSLTDQQRYEHMHVVGGSGHGKTQLLQRLILDDLQREQPPALVIVDSQGEMLRKTSAARPVRPWQAAVRPLDHHRSRGRGLFAGTEHVRLEGGPARDLLADHQGADRSLDHRDVQLRVRRARCGTHQPAEHDIRLRHSA